MEERHYSLHSRGKHALIILVPFAELGLVQCNVDDGQLYSQQPSILLTIYKVWLYALVTL